MASEVENMSEELKPVAFPPLPKGYVTLDGLTRYDAMQVHQYALRYADAVVAAQSRQAAQPVATITECEACFTPDVCRLRGKCDHYSAEQVRVAAQPQQAAQPVAPVGWLYDWTHSSATGRPDERFTSFTADEVYAFKGMGHENVRPVYAAAQPQQATEGSRLSDLRGLLADAQPKQPNGQA